MKAAAPESYMRGGKARGDMKTGQHCIAGLPAAAGVARRIVAKILGPTHPQRDQAELIVSELVSNAIRHTRSGLADGLIGLTVEPNPDGCRIEVIDAGPVHTPTDPALRAHSGFRGGAGAWPVSGAGHRHGLGHGPTPERLLLRVGCPRPESDRK